MALREIVWETEAFWPQEPVWWLEGTAYNERDDLIHVKARVSDERRKEILQEGRISGGIDGFVFPDDEITRLDQG